MLTVHNYLKLFQIYGTFKKVLVPQFSYIAYYPFKNLSNLKALNNQNLIMCNYYATET